MAKATYKDAGVDLDVYRQAMARLPRLLARTYTPRVIPLDGGFAGLFQLDFTNHLFARHYKDPVLVSCTDGVGTKLKVAVAAGIHNTVGIDLVAMSVNDALCCGAEPLFFLDYVAMPKDDPALLEQIVERHRGRLHPGRLCPAGRRDGHPARHLRPGDYDLAGFCVGVAEKHRVIDGRAIEPDDVVIGVASTGLHSNGFSLARKIVFEIAGLKVSDYVEELGETVGEALLRADANLRPPGAKGAELLPREERCPRHRPHHRRRALREPRTHPARGDSGGDRPRQLAGAAGLHLASAARRGRSGRDGPGIQHGHWAGAGGRPVLCREHPPPTGPRRTEKLADRPRAEGPRGVVWGKRSRHTPRL